MAAGSADVGQYTAAAGRGKMGPRASRLAMGAVVATVVITAGLWFGQGALTEMGVLTPSPPATTEPVTPPPEIAPAENGAPAPAPDPTPAPTPAPVSPPVEMPPPVTSPPAVAPPRTDDRAAVDSLDSCAQSFAALCPRATPNATPAGFKPDGALAASERRFLTALQFDVSSPVGSDAAVACKARLGEVTASRRRATAGGSSILSQACGTLTWPAATTPVTATPPVAAPPSSANPTRTPGTVTATIPSRTMTTNATVADLRELDACTSGLAKLCPAPQPTAGFAMDGQMSSQETTLLSSVAPNATSNPDRLKMCAATTASLQRLSAERRAAGSFGQACRSLAPTRTLNQAVVRAATPRVTVAPPQQTPPR